MKPFNPSAFSAWIINALGATVCILVLGVAMTVVAQASTLMA